MKWLLVLHFPKPEQELKKVVVKGSDVAELLTAVLRESEPAKWKDSEHLKELMALFAWAKTDKEGSRFDLLESLRKATIEILNSKCFLSTYQFTSRDDDEIFCKLACEEDVLTEQAHRMHYHLSLSPEVEENLEFRGLMPYAPFDKHYADEKIFAGYEDGSLFRMVDKIRLVKALVDEHLSTCYTDIGKMKDTGIILDFFPIHEEKPLADLRKAMISASLTQPAANLREYFGEKMAFYFLW